MLLMKRENGKPSASCTLPWPKTHLKGKLLKSKKHLDSIQTFLAKASVPESVAASFKDIDNQVYKVQLMHMYHQTIFPGRYFDPALSSEPSHAPDGVSDAADMSTNRSLPIQGKGQVMKNCSS